MCPTKGHFGIIAFQTRIKGLRLSFSMRTRGLGVRKLLYFGKTNDDYEDIIKLQERCIFQL